MGASRKEWARIHALSAHEAGHAVILRNFDQTIVRMSIDPDLGDGQTERSPDGKLTVEQEIMVLYAGTACQNAFAAHCENSLMALKDAARIETLISNLFPAEDDAGAHYAEILKRKTDQLFTHGEIRSAAVALTKRLPKFLTMDGPTVHRIIDPHLRKKEKS